MFIEMCVLCGCYSSIQNIGTFRSEAHSQNHTTHMHIHITLTTTNTTLNFNANIHYTILHITARM